MSLYGVERRLRKIVAAEEVGVVAEEDHAGSELERPGAHGLRNSQLRPNDHARHLALPWLATDKAPGREGRRRHDHIELGRLACKIEGPDIGQQSGVGMEIGVYDRQVGVESQFALG